MFNDFELLHFIDMALSTTTEKNKYPQKDCKDKLYQQLRRQKYDASFSDGVISQQPLVIVDFNQSHPSSSASNIAPR